MDNLREWLGAAWAGFIIGAIVGMIFVGWLFMLDERRAWQKETVERGLATYCPTTGEWAWKGECDPRPGGTP